MFCALSEAKEMDIKMKNRIYLVLTFLILLISGCRAMDYAANAKQESHQMESAQLVESLTEKQKKEIEVLTIALCHNMSGSSYLVDRSILSSEDAESELYTQWFFLWCLNNAEYTQISMEMLRPVVQSIDENSMELTVAQAEELLRMAGAVPAPGLEDYIKNNFSLSYSDDGLLVFEPYYNGGELVSEHHINSIELQTDGRVKVNGITSLNPGYGVVSQFEITFISNKNSVFGGYSVEYFREKLPNYPGMKTVGEGQILPEHYTKPSSASENPFDYIFELDSYMYQMPFPAGELINGGWTLEENGELGEGGRIVIHASKNGQRISVGLWNYTMISSRYEDCYVVWLKTNAIHHWAQIDFHLLGGAVRNGMNQGELKAPVTCNWYKHTPGNYLVSDPLYSSKYGYEIFLENQSVVGFEVGYAPNPYSRSQRLNILTGNGWEKDPVIEPPYDKIIEMQLSHIYKVDIDHDGEQENIDIKFLDGIGASSGILCIIVDGDVVASVEGATDILIGDVIAKMSFEDNKVILTIDGYDAQNNEIHKQFCLKKGQSEVIASYVNGKPN